MSTRPRRAALHQRSDSETNEIRIVPSLHSNNSSVSQKANDVSSWVPHPTTASISRDSTRSSSRTVSTRCRGRGSHQNSGSLDNLPPIAPLHINKTEPGFIIARDPIAAAARESPYSVTLVGGSNPSLNATPITIKKQTFPKSILKKPSRAVLPPNSTEEYKQRSSSWVGNSSQSPTSAGRARMNTRTLRIVRDEADEDDQDEESEGINTVGELVGRSATGAPSPRTWPLSESSAHVGYPFPNWSLPARSPSSASLQRPGTAGSLFASAKQLPSWARYVFLWMRPADLQIQLMFSKIFLWEEGRSGEYHRTRYVKKQQHKCNNRQGRFPDSSATQRWFSTDYRSHSPWFSLPCTKALRFIGEYPWNRLDRHSNQNCGSWSCYPMVNPTPSSHTAVQIRECRSSVDFVLLGIYSADMLDSRCIPSIASVLWTYNEESALDKWRICILHGWCRSLA